MYGRIRTVTLAADWVEPAVLKDRWGFSWELTCKFIHHSIAVVNKYIDGNRYIRHMGVVGSWSQEEIYRLVLPTESDLMVEVDDIYDSVTQYILQQKIVEELYNS